MARTGMLRQSVAAHDEDPAIMRKMPPLVPLRTHESTSVPWPPPETVECGSTACGSSGSTMSTSASSRHLGAYRHRAARITEQVLGQPGGTAAGAVQGSRQSNSACRGLSSWVQEPCATGHVQEACDRTRCSAAKTCTDRRTTAGVPTPFVPTTSSRQSAPSSKPSPSALRSTGSTCLSGESSWRRWISSVFSSPDLAEHPRRLRRVDGGESTASGGMPSAHRRQQVATPCNPGGLRAP